MDRDNTSYFRSSIALAVVNVTTKEILEISLGAIPMKLVGLFVIWITLKLDRLLIRDEETNILKPGGISIKEVETNKTEIEEDTREPAPNIPMKIIGVMVLILVILIIWVYFGSVVMGMAFLTE